MFKVRQSVPVQIHSRGRKSLLGLDRLKPGQHVLVPIAQLAMREDDAPNQPMQRLRSQVSAYQRKYKLTTDDGSDMFTRVFRVGVPDHRGVRIVRVI